MSHKFGSPTSENIDDFRFLHKQSNKLTKNSCLLNTFNADSKYSCCCGKTEVQHRMKRLKTRKDRDQMRGVGKEISKAKSHHHHHQSSKHAAHVNVCCHSKSHCSSRMNPNFPGVIPAAQERSIITDSRLIGHHGGLFNHKVKSFDIERFLSEQNKLEKSGEHENKKTSVSAHPSSADLRTSFFSEGTLASETEPSVVKTAGHATKAHDDCQQKQNTNLPFSNEGTDITPGPRPAQQPDLVGETSQSIFFSKPGISSPVTTTLPNSKSALSEKSKESQLSPVGERHNFKTQSLKSKSCTISTREQTPINLDPPVLQTKACDPSPLHPPSSSTAGSCNTQHRKEDPDCVSSSVRSVAARLCDTLQVPKRIRKNLVSETKAELLKSLQKMHGPWSNETLLNFGPDPTRATQNHQVIAENDYISPAEDRQCHWKSSPKLQQSLKRTAERWTSPMDMSSGHLEDSVRPSVYPPFSRDFEPSTASTSDIFAPFPTLCRKKKASQSSRWEDCFNVSKRKEPFQLDLFENSFMNHTEQSSCRPKSFDIQPHFHQQAKPLYRHSYEPKQFPQEEDPFEFNTRSFAPSFAAQRNPPPPLPPRISHAHSFNQRTHTVAHPPFRPKDTDMMHFPPSHQLERAETHVTSFQSPVHWSFPRMRLY